MHRSGLAGEQSVLHCYSVREYVVMRDIRNDLRERVQLMEARIGARNAHYEKMIKRLQSERDAAVAAV